MASSVRGDLCAAKCQRSGFDLICHISVAHGHDVGSGSLRALPSTAFATAAPLIADLIDGDQRFVNAVTCYDRSRDVAAEPTCQRMTLLPRSYA